MIKIVVASKNPVKVSAVKLGFSNMFPKEKLSCIGVSAPSGVSGQPMSENETIRGASNRANNVSKLLSDADYWVGIEGGVKETQGHLEAFAWVVIKSKLGSIGKGRTGSFYLPKRVSDLIKKGKEFGAASDRVFGSTDLKKGSGTIGLLTRDTITRTTYYEAAVVFALIPFKNSKLYS